MVMARIYRDILEYRKTDPRFKEELYPIIHKLQSKTRYGLIMFGIAGLFLCINLIAPYKSNVDSRSIPNFINIIYFAISRPAWILSVMLIIVTIFLGHGEAIKNLLSIKYFRILSRMTAMSCLVVLTVAYLILCSDNLPRGVFINLQSAAILGVGFIFITQAFAMVLTLVIEFPLKRLY